MRKFNVFRRGKCHMTLLAGLLTMYSASAQETFPVNGVAEPKNVVYAFVHATIVKDGQTTLNNCTLRSGNTIIAVDVNKGRIDVFAFAINDDRFFRRNQIRAYRKHFSSFDNQCAVI